MKINEVAKKLNIPPSTIRYYEQRGLILSLRSDNGYRQYNNDSLELLKLLIYAKNLGFTLNEIKVFAKAMVGTGLEKQKVNQAMEKKVEELNQKITDLKKFQKNLKKALSSECPLDHIYRTKN